jgi:hypothetical protein
VEEQNKAPVTDLEWKNPIVSMFDNMGREARRAFIKNYDKERVKLPDHMAPDAQVPDDMKEEILGAWKSKHFSAIAYPSQAQGVLCRLTVNRMAIDPATGLWLSGISWDELYRIKNECGFGAMDAVEVFPAENKLVNVSNMRHLWVMKGRLHFSL